MKITTHRTHTLVRTLAIIALLPVAAQAENNGITARYGTLGVGVEFGIGLSSMSQVRLGVNGGSRSYSTSESGVEYDVDLNLRSGEALLDLRPFNGNFYTTVGALYNKNKFDVKAKAGTMTIGSNTYTNPDLTGEITFKKFSPYLGIGWGSKLSAKGFAWMFDLGVVYQGSPDVTFSSSSGVSQADLDSEAAELEEALKDKKYYPHVGFSFGARF